MQALEEEKVLFDRSSSRMIYMNVSTLALKRVRNQTQLQLNEMKKRSDTRVKALAKPGEEGEAAGSSPSSSSFCKVDVNQKKKEKIVGQKQLSVKPGAVAEAKKGWRSLEAELQAAFETSRIGLSSPSSDKPGTMSSQASSAVFASSKFYSKKTPNESAESVEPKSKLKSKKVLPKERAMSSGTSSGMSKSSFMGKSASEKMAGFTNTDQKDLPQKKGRHSTDSAPVKHTGSSDSANDDVKKRIPPKTKTKSREVPQRKVGNSTECTPSNGMVIAKSNSAKAKCADSAQTTRRTSSTESAHMSTMSTVFADSAQIQHHSRSGSFADDPIDLTTELFGESDSETEEEATSEVFFSNHVWKKVSDVVSDDFEDEQLGEVLGVSLHVPSVDVWSNRHKPRHAGDKSKAKSLKRKSKREVSAPENKRRKKCRADEGRSSTVDEGSSQVNEQSADQPSVEEPCFESDDIMRLSSEGEGFDDEGLGSSSGISFDSALCSVDSGATSKVGGAKAKKAHAKKLKVKKMNFKVAMGERNSILRNSATAERGSVSNESCSQTDKRESKPSQLDLSKFNLKAPTLRLAKTPTLSPQGFKFPLASVDSNEETTLEASSSIGASVVDDGPTELGQLSPLSGESGTPLSVDEGESSKKAVALSHLPSGPLINLTKVAAKHKKMSSASLMSKQAQRGVHVSRKKTTPTAPPTSTAQPKPTFSIVRRKEIELTGACTYRYTHTLSHSSPPTHAHTHTSPTSKPDSPSHTHFLSPFSFVVFQSHDQLPTNRRSTQRQRLPSAHLEARRGQYSPGGQPGPGDQGCRSECHAAPLLSMWETIHHLQQWPVPERGGVCLPLWEAHQE